MQPSLSESSHQAVSRSTATLILHWMCEAGAAWLRALRRTRLAHFRTLFRISLNNQSRNVPEGSVAYFESHLSPNQFLCSISSCLCSPGSLASLCESRVAVELNQACYIQSDRFICQASGVVRAALEVKHRGLPDAPSPVSMMT